MAVNTRVVLTQEVSNLGSLGDEVSVKRGYARNYLLPRALAIPAQGEAAQVLRHRRKQLEQLRRETVEQAREMGQRIVGLEFVSYARAAENGHLYGSVGVRQVQKLLGDQGFPIEARCVLLEHPLRQTGTHDVLLRLHSEVRVTMRLRIEAEEPHLDEEAPQDSKTAQATESLESSTDAEEGPPTTSPTDSPSVADPSPSSEASAEENSTQDA